METLKETKIIEDISFINLKENVKNKEKIFDFISYLESYKNDKNINLFDGDYLNPILDKHKLKEVYNQLLEIDLDNEIRLELMNIIKNSFNIKTDINIFLLTPEKIIKNKCSPFTFEEIFYLWQRGLIK